ncbi:hypothetical protein [uncultured Methylobacterium sp.]|uniref:hypothetical protein n=1 Tax=uncultured Methylobacterium sp. TaxID=157278 RepID=UPI0035CA9D74
MNAFRKLAAVTIAAGTLIGIATQAHAESPTFYIQNNTPMPVWVSINTQAFGRGTVVRACIEPQGLWSGNPVDINQHTNVYIRSEFKKQNRGCDQNANLYDNGANGTILTINKNGRSQMTYYSPDKKTNPSRNNSLWH